MLGKRNLAAYLCGSLDVRLEESDVPTPGNDEVLVEMQACGICGTDVHMWTHGECGDFRVTQDRPVVIGHESSGVVIARGDLVKNLDIGDRVALELGLPCRKCEFCKTGHYNLCKGFSLGGLQRYNCYAADFCHRLPDNVSYEEGALLEPLAVAVRAVKRAGVTLGSSVLVCGAGPIGLCCLMVARATGCNQVAITDLSEDRLEMARESFGADHTILVKRTDPCEQVVKLIESTLGGKADYAIECTGVENSLRVAIFATKPGGKVAPVGLGENNVTIPLVYAATREIDINGVFSYCNDYPSAVSLVASGKVRPAPMITQRFILEQTLEALTLAQTQQGVVKIMVDCSK